MSALDRIERRKIATEKFMARLEELGGCLSVAKTAALLGVDVSEVKRLLDKGTLLSIQLKGEEVCPAFQFVAGALPKGYQELLGCMSGSLSNVAKIGWLLAVPYDKRVEPRAPIEILKSLKTLDCPEFQHLKLLASEFGHHVA